MCVKSKNPYVDPASKYKGELVGISKEGVITDKYKDGFKRVLEVNIDGEIQKVIVEKKDNYSKEIGKKVNVLSLRVYGVENKKLKFARERYNNVLKSEVKRGVDYIYYEDTGKVTNLDGDIIKK